VRPQVLCYIRSRSTATIIQRRRQMKYVWRAGGMTLTGENWSTGREACHRAGQVSLDVPADVAFICDKAAALGDTRKGTHSTFGHTTRHIFSLWRLFEMCSFRQVLARRISYATRSACRCSCQVPTIFLRFEPKLECTKTLQ
jgi:hypothetical protein